MIKMKPILQKGLHWLIMKQNNGFRFFGNCKEKKNEKSKWCQSDYEEPRVLLEDSPAIPMIGLGTWLSQKDKVTEAVKAAIDVGYRHFDCAHVYMNECEVGNAIEAKIKEGCVKREDLFITSKLWNTFHRRDLVRCALEQSLEDLKLKYVDLYLIHWPMAYKEGCDLFPCDNEGRVIHSPVDYLDTWRELENMVDAGLTKSIGLSNFNRRQIERILKIAKVRPVTNQVECHPYLTQKKLENFCKSSNISLTAYSPLGAPKRPWAKKDDPVILEEIEIRKIACEKNKSPAQVLIRYQIQRGNIVIPKSIDPDHIRENYDVFNFELTEKEISIIESCNCNIRLVPMLNEAGSHKYYPFHDEY